MNKYLQNINNGIQREIKSFEVTLLHKKLSIHEFVFRVDLEYVVLQFLLLLHYRVLNILELFNILFDFKNCPIREINKLNHQDYLVLENIISVRGFCVLENKR